MHLSMQPPILYLITLSKSLGMIWQCRFVRFSKPANVVHCDLKMWSASSSASSTRTRFRIIDRSI